MEKHKDDEFSLGEMLTKTRLWIGSILSQWIKLAIVGIIGGCVGFFYAWFKPITYTARLSFVVEDGKSSVGGLASLAGQFGLDVGGATNGGLLSGENLLLFLQSANLTKEVLLSPYDSSKNYSLADKYADEYKLRDAWSKNKNIGNVQFPVTSKQVYTRLQDSLLQVIGNMILQKELLVERPEKKATFIVVESKMRDELLSKYYCERLVAKAVDRYIQSKIKRQKLNVDRLQNRSDSIAGALNNKTYISALDQEKVLDVNPGARTATVNAEVSTRDKMMLGAIYGEVVKNLEIAKVQLSQETPTIQIVDDIQLPTKKNRTSKSKMILAGMILSLIIAIPILTIMNIQISKKNNTNE